MRGVEGRGKAEKGGVAQGGLRWGEDGGMGGWGVGRGWWWGPVVGERDKPGVRARPPIRPSCLETPRVSPCTTSARSSH